MEPDSIAILVPVTDFLDDLPVERKPDGFGASLLLAQVRGLFDETRNSPAQRSVRAGAQKQIPISISPPALKPRSGRAKGPAAKQTAGLRHGVGHDVPTRATDGYRRAK
jgi:hypothetical protein